MEDKISISHLNKRYGQEVIFQDFNFEFKKNQVTGIVGPSGSGKTTLVRILAGLETPDSGTFAGVSPGNVAFVFQEDRLLPWLTVGQNIAFVLKRKLNASVSENKVDEVLTQMSLLAYKDYLPGQLSGGMQRRVAIGRALAYEAELLIMDEPFKGLDLELKNEILADLVQMWEKTQTTVLVITHDLEDAKHWCHQIIELSGRPIAARNISVKG